MPDRGKPCVLVSGGLDSAVALAEAARGGGAAPVYVRSGLAWERAEMYWVGRILDTLGDSVDPLVTLDVPVADLYGSDHWSLAGRPPDAESPDEAVYLPGRNLLLLAKVGVHAARAGHRAIVLGTLAANPFPDASRAFLDSLGEAIGRAMGLEGPLPIETPLAGVTKAAAVARAIHLGVPLELTFSCLDPTPDHGHCGACNKCAERRRGFAEAGVADPTRYGSS